MSTAGTAFDPDFKKLTDREREARLQQIRRDAESGSLAPSSASNVHAASGPSYYGQPLLKSPAWTWQIPIYFFVGGAAGASSVLASAAHWTDADRELIRDARWIAAIGGVVSPALLVSDLGYPSRFLNMLRVFKPQSAMSMGSWTLMAFSSSTAAAAFLSSAKRSSRGVLRTFVNGADMLAAMSGAALATYTGVLIGVTAVPVWNNNVGLLPIHFAASGLSSAVSILELRGHSDPALNAIGLAACAGEAFVGACIELDKRRESEPLRSGKTGWLTRLGGVLSGPLPLLLRIAAATTEREPSARLRKVAALSSIAGSLITRTAWLSAGKVSVQDPSLELTGTSQQTDAIATN
jgi:formate-dependent nitrite reductase membrane component NrfD